LTRDEIFADVLADLNREDKADRLPGWLKATEMRINLSLRDERMVKRALLPITGYIFPYPLDFQQAKSLTIRQHIAGPPVAAGAVVAEAKYVPPDHISDGYVAPSAAYPRGPVWFTTRGRNVELGNWNLDGTYQAELWYYANLDKLTEGTDTNWLTELAPHIYKLGMVHFGFQHLLEPGNATTKLQEFAAEIQFLNQQNEKVLTPTGPLLMRPVRGYGAGVSALRRR
jgi:hypothetical protein